jgi:hypothetical protein
MINVKHLVKISDDRPAQWEGVVGEKGSAYIRYRWGYLEVSVSETSGDPIKDRVRVFDRGVGGKYDGQMSTEEMKAILKELLTFDS